MKREAVYHLNTENYIYPVSRSRLRVKLRTAKGDIKECLLLHFDRTKPDAVRSAVLKKQQSDALFDYYYGHIDTSKVARYQKYYFKLTDYDGKEIFYCPIGFSSEKPEDFFEYLYTNPNDVVRHPDWSYGTIYYQIFPERFKNGDTQNDPPGTEKWGSTPTRENYMGGDIRGIIEEIPYLKELGIETIYMNPIFYADFNHKYATTDYYRIDPIFGTNDDFREMVDKLHESGIRILLDGVFNHTGIHFKPFRDVLENGRDSRYYNWFLPVKENEIKISHKDYECVGAYKYMPKLNSSNPEVREFILNVMDHWIREYGIDGWRLDVADELDINVWQEACMVLRQRYPDIFLLGETWGYGGRLTDGKMLDSVMNYMFRDAVRDYFGYEKIGTDEFDSRINTMLSLYKNETGKVLYNLLDSHDTERFLNYCSGDTDKMKLAVAFQFLFIGSPAIYYGDEVGINGENDPDCRKCMIWGDEQNRELLDWYKKLIKIRKDHVAVRTGDYMTTFIDDENEIICFERREENEKIQVIIRKGKRNDASVKVKGSGINLITGQMIAADTAGFIDVEPYSVKAIKTV
ncbi:Glycosidase [Lachnospiraceae bacterium]|nr:Glycosidase [Lachnospiraceae bacterium]